jgi:hypothetical protein
MAQIEESKIETYDMNVSDVKASIPRLQAKDYKDGQILRNITIVGFESHNVANEHKDEKTGEITRFKESWAFVVDYDKKQWIIRFGAKDIVVLRDELKFGSDIQKWIGKTIELVVKQYNVGKGFGVCI